MEERKEFLKELLETAKESLFHDFVFAKDDLIHTLQRAAYLEIVRGAMYVELAPLQTDDSLVPVPSGYVFVLYDFQVDVSIPFVDYIRVYNDGAAWFVHAGIPSVWSWKVIGWEPTEYAMRIISINRSLVDTIYESEIIRFLRFKTEDWYSFKENFLHPLEYYARTIMERRPK